VDPVGAGRDHALHFVAEPREIGRQKARGDAVGACRGRHGARQSVEIILGVVASHAAPRIARMSKPEFSVSVAVRHLPEQSDPQTGQHAFAYTVTIRNSGDITAQLIARHWIITDAAGHTDEVRGLAVVGHQPLLKPGEQFEYTSWTRIGAPNGTMRGTFYCMTEDARPFDARVPEFGLTVASTLP